MSRPRVVGLTGGIASGKSSVSQLFAKLGARIVDADVAARKVVEPGSEGQEQVIAAFGHHLLQPDGTLNRKELGRIIFSDREARRRLESITHPLIFRHMYLELQHAIRTDAPVVILDIPLLFETGLFMEEIDESVVVYTHPKTQLQRLMERDGLSEAEARSRVQAQIPIDEKARRAEHVIDNSGTPEQTQQQVWALWKEWTTHDEDRFDRTR